MSLPNEWLECIECHKHWPLGEIRYSCDCSGLLEVQRDWNKVTVGPDEFDKRLLSRESIDISGVWRFREAVLNISTDQCLSHPEGQTRLYKRTAFENFAGISNLFLKHEGDNPTGSFKDRGMTVAVSQAKVLGQKNIACASTGNTSASLAAYGAHGGMNTIVFLPAGKVAVGKIAQAIGYGATCLAVDGDFDQAMALVREVSERGVYMVNSLNPFRLEGQKTIMWEMLQNLGWQAPDWVVVPGGNLGNTSAFGKALLEAKSAGWISKLPRLVTVQAAGANPFFQSYKEKFQQQFDVQAETVATAIRIGRPVNYTKAYRVIENLNGIVEDVSDQEIMSAKKVIDKAGVGCEPASACSLAGIKKLKDQGIIGESDTVVGILTGHMLKDPEAILSDQSSLSVKNIEASMDAVMPYIK